MQGRIQAIHGFTKNLSAHSGARPANAAAIQRPVLMSSATGTISGMTDTAPTPLRADKAYEAGPDEVRGLIVSSPVMPLVVEGPLEPPPLTAPTPPAAAQPPKTGSDD